MAAQQSIDYLSYDAWLFDLDGVVTDTASVHFTCWKQAFDEYLRDKPDFREFSMEDYHRYVDGKPRYDGVDSFLKSRGIDLPWGDPADGPDKDTVCGVGNAKNVLVNDALAKGAAVLFDGTKRLIDQLKAKGKRVAIVTSSKNCDTVLKAVGMDKTFEVQVDGNIAAAQKIAGKPKPDTYLRAAELLGVSAAKAAVIEDAVSGVQAGRDGGFGLVIGIDRHGGAGLEANGATIVVADLSEIDLR